MAKGRDAPLASRESAPTKQPFCFPTLLSLLSSAVRTYFDPPSSSEAIFLQDPPFSPFAPSYALQKETLGAGIDEKFPMTTRRLRPRSLRSFFSFTHLPTPLFFVRFLLGCVGRGREKGGFSYCVRLLASLPSPFTSLCPQAHLHHHFPIPSHGRRRRRRRRKRRRRRPVSAQYLLLRYPVFAHMSSLLFPLLLSQHFFLVLLSPPSLPSDRRKRRRDLEL